MKLLGENDVGAMTTAFVISFKYGANNYYHLKKISKICLYFVACYHNEKEKLNTIYLIFF